MKISLPRYVQLPHATLLPALWLPRPGTARGACSEPCTHLMCGSLLKVAAMQCALCGQALGWETPIYQLPGEAQAEGETIRLIHALCAITYQE